MLPHSYVIGTNFVPKEFVVINVTNATKCVVTTDGDHGYSTGWIVQLIVPTEYGMFVPDVYSQITVLTSDTFRCEDIDTLHALPFLEPTSPPAYTFAQCVPISGVTFNKLPEQGPW